MIPKFICWLFGHKDIIKAFSGRTTELGGLFYEWEKQEFCLRCGKSNNSTDKEK